MIPFPWTDHDPTLSRHESFRQGPENKNIPPPHERPANGALHFGGHRAAFVRRHSGLRLLRYGLPGKNPCPAGAKGHERRPEYRRLSGRKNIQPLSRSRFRNHQRTIRSRPSTDPPPLSAKRLSGRFPGSGRHRRQRPGHGPGGKFPGRSGTGPGSVVPASHKPSPIRQQSCPVRNALLPGRAHHRRADGLAAPSPPRPGTDSKQDPHLPPRRSGGSVLPGSPGRLQRLRRDEPRRQGDSPDAGTAIFPR